MIRITAEVRNGGRRKHAALLCLTRILIHGLQRLCRLQNIRGYHSTCAVQEPGTRERNHVPEFDAIARVGRGEAAQGIELRQTGINQEASLRMHVDSGGAGVVDEITCCADERHRVARSRC